MKAKPKWCRSERHKAAQEFYERWSACHNRCQVCGVSAAFARHNRWPGLSTHHIVKAGRFHEATNLIRLCQRCHDLAEGLDTPVWLPTKFYYPKLTLPHILWVKRDRDPDDFDPSRLAQILMRPLPEPQEPPGVFRAEYALRTTGVKPERLDEWLAGFPGDARSLLAQRMQPWP